MISGVRKTISGRYLWYTAVGFSRNLTVFSDFFIFFTLWPLSAGIWLIFRNRCRYLLWQQIIKDRWIFCWNLPLYSDPLNSVHFDHNLHVHGLFVHEDSCLSLCNVDVETFLEAHVAALFSIDVSPVFVSPCWAVSFATHIPTQVLWPKPEI